MSNHDEIVRLVAEGHLFEIARRDLRATDRGYRRWIYVSSEMNKEIVRRSEQPTFRRLSAQFQNFTIGGTIPVALVPNHKKAEWARLAPADHEVWGNACPPCSS